MLVYWTTVFTSAQLSNTLDMVKKGVLGPVVQWMDNLLTTGRVLSKVIYLFRGLQFIQWKMQSPP